MPIEIRELIIRAELKEPPKPVQPIQPAPTDPQISMAEIKDAVIEACVEQVLAILEKQKER
ncbi:MAG: hypothetical protein H6563_08425 [Lewinellaceae bacterium]|nr:hypothetical protein [Lewinellaceae bacterium]